MNKNEYMAMSLPYGLKIKSQHQIFTLHAYIDSVEVPSDYDHISIGNVIEENEHEENAREHHKPILRQLSELTTEIEHNGEKFIPISILFDLESGTKWSSTDYLTYGNSKNEFYTCFKKKPTFYFGYNREKGSFYCINQFGFHQMVNNQISLFKKLIEWHFDIAGLIEKGEAVDYHTLPDFVF